MPAKGIIFMRGLALPPSPQSESRLPAGPTPKVSHVQTESLSARRPRAGFHPRFVRRDVQSADGGGGGEADGGGCYNPCN